MLRRPVIMIAAAIALGAAAAVVAQNDMSKVEIKTTDVAPGIAMLKGAGGNIGVFSGPDGVVLVDDQYAPLSDKIKAAVTKISDKPLRYILNTHWHGDHTGGNENFARMGVTIIAQDNARARMMVPYSNPVLGWKADPSPTIALPVISFNDSLSFHLNGQDVACFHVRNAHTDGDVMVWFPQANVFHAGDCLFTGQYPIIDVGSGGTLDGMIAALEKILVIVKPDTKIISGHSPIATKDDVQGAHDMLVDVRGRVKKLLASGQTLEQIQAAKPLADLEGKWGKGYITADLMLKTAVYDLSRK